MSDGDARKALSALEIAALTTPADSNSQVRITLEIAEESIQKKHIMYDKKGDQHYDTISAFIKSMRGSDPDAAVYYLAKMIYVGEDPRFIARRIVICASEDVGNADPMALIIATSALRAVEFIGMPEARIPLAQATIYVAKAPKSNATYKAIEEALKDIATEETMEVPDHLKDSHYPGAKKLGHGKGYKYPHNYGGYVEQDYLPKKKKYYKP
jgi:putative ATPase